MSVRLPTYEDVIKASNTLGLAAYRSPVLTSQTINARLDSQVFFKCENFQRIGAFK